MTIIYFWIFVALLSANLLAVLYNPKIIYEYPYFMAFVFAAFIFPQTISLIRFPGGVRPDGVSDVLLMSCLCLAACWAGYQVKPSKSTQKKLVFPVNENRMFHGAIVFIIISYFCNHLLNSLSDEEKGGSTWSGPSTIYLFFSNLTFPALVISLSATMQRVTLASILAVAASIAGPLEATFHGRRENTAQLILVFALTLFYKKNIKPSRLLITVGLVAAMLAIPATTKYRTYVSEGSYDQIRHLDLIDNFNHFLNEESILELRNAAFMMESSTDLHDYAYGSAYWDNMVFRFVPAQILGKGFKNGLMIHSAEDEELKDKVSKLDYAIPGGSTVTGMGDSFQQFGWFGCLFFALLGILFKILYQATRTPYGLLPQMLYALICTSAMRAVTHQTVDFLPGLFYNFIFLGLLYLYAREPGKVNWEPQPDNPSLRQTATAGAGRFPGRDIKDRQSPLKDL